MPNLAIILCVLVSAFGLNASTARGGMELEDVFDEYEAPWLTRSGSRATGSERETGREQEAEPEDEHLETDRDSFTPATTTVGAGRLLFESAYSFIDNKSTADSHSFPEIVTRYGIHYLISPDFEFGVRVGWGLNNDAANSFANVGFGIRL